jgi:ABC-type transport system substrate-binding protein
VKISKPITQTLKAWTALPLCRCPNPASALFRMNHEKEPYNNVKIPQAGAYAIDRQNLI